MSEPGTRGHSPGSRRRRWELAPDGTVSRRPPAPSAPESPGRPWGRQADSVQFCRFPAVAFHVTRLHRHPFPRPPGAADGTLGGDRAGGTGRVGVGVKPGQRSPQRTAPPPGPAVPHLREARPPPRGPPPPPPPRARPPAPSRQGPWKVSWEQTGCFCPGHVSAVTNGLRRAHRLERSSGGLSPCETLPPQEGAGPRGHRAGRRRGASLDAVQMPVMCAHPRVAGSMHAGGSPRAECTF